MLRAAGLIVLLSLGFAVVLAACAPREIPYTTLTAKYALPSSNYFEPAPGLKVHYTDEGNTSGAVIVLVHGFAASVHAWRPWIDRLRGDYRFVALDLPGHGLTQAPANYRASLDKNVALVNALADHLQLDHFLLGGNSMGGGVALNYALSHPERLSALVLVDAAGWPGEKGTGGSGPPLVFQLLTNPIGRAILKSVNPRMFAVGGLKAAYLDKRLVTDALINRYVELALAPGHRDILITQNSAPHLRITKDDIRSIKIPTLVLAGEKDKIIAVEQSKSLAAAIPGAVLITYPNGGHVPMEQLPEQSAADLKAFIDALPGRGAAYERPDSKG
ncbi:MAG: alpha/beta fold hydrolase [Alphaproteobacteria bacterium]|nr:alpha/beta fold hydrolase [Alphaproteobacteria bacterium]